MDRKLTLDTLFSFLIIMGKNHLTYLSLFIFLYCLVIACDNKNTLPILSKSTIKNGVSSYERIPDFQFINQDSQLITPATFTDKIYVVDFFFTSCPTICPTLAKEMKRIYKYFEKEEKLKLLSHTIDPKRDTVGRLATYAQNLEASSDKWHFVTGDKRALFEIAEDYFNIVLEDSSVPEGLDHSGRIVLVDTQGHIRAFCNGTKPEEVDRFITDIERLLQEYENL